MTSNYQQSPSVVTSVFCVDRVSAEVLLQKGGGI